MTALQNSIREGIQHILGQQGYPTFMWNGENFNCVPNTLNDGVAADAVMAEADFRMTVPFQVKRNGVYVNQFTPNIYPTLTNTITYLGTQLKVKQIKKPAHGVFWVYVCEIPKFNG